MVAIPLNTLLFLIRLDLHTLIGVESTKDIPELQIDGLVHVTSLQNDYYRYEAGSQSLIGDRSGTRYRLGDALAIVVSRVDLETKRIDFQLSTPRTDGKRKR